LDRPIAQKDGENEILYTYFRVFWESKAAVMAIVVGSEAAQTPSRFKVFSEVPVATIKGGAH